VEKPFLAQDQLAVSSFSVGLAMTVQKPSNGRPVKPEVGSLLSTKYTEMPNLELFRLAPINVVRFRVIAHNKSSASPSATSLNWSKAIFV
jgi:hypothetical protein